MNCDPTMISESGEIIYYHYFSDNTKIQSKIEKDTINVLYQFYIDPHNNRYQEIKETLQKNVEEYG